MGSESARLVIHGVPASQPVRAVCWTCLIKGLPFELRPVRFDEAGDERPLLRLNPTGQVPTIEDGAFALYEMPAILIYLSEKHGWDDLLPADLRTRARVHQYLHFHHSFTRRATTELMSPHVMAAFPERIRGTPREAKALHPDRLQLGQAAVRDVAGLIEGSCFQDGSTFLCAPAATIADIACYEELAQLRWASLFDFDGFPKLRHWLEEMEKLPFHEQAHQYNIVLGDIRTRPLTGERFAEASEASIAVLGK